MISITPAFVLRPSVTEIDLLRRLQDETFYHESGGGYDVLAKFVKGGKVANGKNCIDRPAQTIDTIYPSNCGVHAELDLWRKHPNMKNGSVFVAGKRNRTGDLMPNTRPCRYCATILFQAGVKNAIYFQDDMPTKAAIKDLIGD